MIRYPNTLAHTNAFGLEVWILVKLTTHTHTHAHTHTYIFATIHMGAVEIHIRDTSYKKTLRAPAAGRGVSLGGARVGHAPPPTRTLT